MLYGDWESMRTKGEESGHNVDIMSSYAYRGQPVGGKYLWHADEDGVSTKLWGVRPIIRPRVGQPLFRTEKEYGGRAIVSDAWDKGFNMDARGVMRERLTNSPLEESQLVPGMGLAAHRKGYNVLYNDGHVAWYGDPTEKLIWHTDGMQTHWLAVVPANVWAGCFEGGDVGSGATNAPVSGSTPSWSSNPPGSLGPFNATNGNNVFPHSPYGIWHEFDVAAGIDVGVDGF